jgi:hypothetical protein
LAKEAAGRLACCELASIVAGCQNMSSPLGSVSRLALSMNPLGRVGEAVTSEQVTTSCQRRTSSEGEEQGARRQQSLVVEEAEDGRVA